jgi:hypothetical protein
MTLSYEQITTPITEAAAEEDLIESYSDMGFTATSWQSGSDQLTTLKVMAHLWSKVAEYAASIAKFGNNEDASGTGLTRYAKSVYDNARVGATVTIGKMRFTTAVGEGPHTINLGDIVVTDEVSTYRNTETGNLTSASPVSLTMEAEVAGSASVIPPNTTLAMVSSFAGVTVTNPVLAGSNTWMTQVGTDAESDPLLRQRNATKWATLGAGEVVLDRVVNLMLNADPSIQKVVVDDENPRGVFTCDVYIGGATTVVDAGALEAAQAALDLNFFKNQTVGQVPRVWAQSSAALPLTLVGVVYFDSNFQAAAVQANVEAALNAFVASVPIGGLNLPPALEHVVPLGDIQQAIENATGVLTAELTTPAANISMLFEHQLVEPASYGLTYQAVSSDYYNG